MKDYENEMLADLMYSHSKDMRRAKRKAKRERKEEPWLKAHTKRSHKNRAFLYKGFDDYDNEYEFM